MFGHACRCLDTPADVWAHLRVVKHARQGESTPPMVGAPADGQTRPTRGGDTPADGWTRPPRGGTPADGRARLPPHQREEGELCADAVSKRLWREDGIRIDRVATDYRPIPSRHRAFPYGDFKWRRQRTRVRLVALEWRQYTVERKVTRNVHFAQNRSFHPLSRLHEHGT